MHHKTDVWVGNWRKGGWLGFGRAKAGSVGAAEGNGWGRTGHVSGCRWLRPQQQPEQVALTLLTAPHDNSDTEFGSIFLRGQLRTTIRTRISEASLSASLDYQKNNRKNNRHVEG